MNLGQLRSVLNGESEKNLSLVLPGGRPIPADFHVTEVGHVTKRFVDCGGTERTNAACVLQTWVARNDPEHRLSAGKLAAILDLAKKVVPSDDLEVEIEYEDGVISQFPLLAVDRAGVELIFTLGSKHTDCLDKEACGLESCGCGPDDGEGGRAP